jgi:hypothetical protein
MSSAKFVNTMTFTLGMLCAHRAQDLQPAAIDEVNIEQDDVRRVASNAGDGRGGTGKFAHHVGTFDLGEHLAQQVADNG